jgi:hypothetical protein
MVSEPVRRDEAGIGELMSQLVVDARDMAQAEIGLVKARASASVNRYKSAAAFFGVAAVLGLSGLIALLVGLIMSLSPLIGPLLATLAVVGTMFLISAVLALVGKSRLSVGELS